MKAALFKLAPHVTLHIGDPVLGGEVVGPPEGCAVTQKGDLAADAISRRRVICCASLPGSDGGMLCLAFRIPTFWINRKRSASMWMIEASILSILPRMS
jgi:hypothetical protein